MKRGPIRCLFLAFLFSLALPPLIDTGAAANIVNYGTDSDDSQIYLGTPDPDTILQFGRGGNDTQYASGAAANDWLEQDGGDGNDTQDMYWGVWKRLLFISLAGNGDDTHAG